PESLPEAVAILRGLIERIVMIPQPDQPGVSGKGTPWLSVVVGLGYAGCVALTPRFHAYD
ncbi:hypothetical protein, partial [Rhodobacter capsulatus]|uniref:hypothetical protein n=1 Tax=Rhodobacter capsulatus TaxID=1061 RepID=UPI001BAF665B